VLNKEQNNKGVLLASPQQVSVVRLVGMLIPMVKSLSFVKVLSCCIFCGLLSFAGLIVFVGLIVF